MAAPFFPWDWDVKTQKPLEDPQRKVLPVNINDSMRIRNDKSPGVANVAMSPLVQNTCNFLTMQNIKM